MRFVTGGCLPDFPPAARQVFDSRHRRLTEVFGMCAETYNALVEWWRGSYLWWCEHNNRETGRYLSPSRVRSAPPAERGPSGRSEWSVLSVKVRRGSSAVSRTGYPFLLRPMCAHPVDERGPCGLPPFPPADVPDVPVLKPVGLYKGTDDAVYHFGWGRCRRKGCGLAGDTPHAETRQPGKARLAVAGVESGGPRAALVAGDRRGAPVRVPSRSHRIVSKHDAVVVEDLAVSNILNSRMGRPVQCWTDISVLRRCAGLQSLGSWYPVREGEPVEHEHRLLHMRTPASDADVRNDLRVWQLAEQTSSRRPIPQGRRTGRRHRTVSPTGNSGLPPSTQRCRSLTVCLHRSGAVAVPSVLYSYVVVMRLPTPICLYRKLW